MKLNRFKTASTFAILLLGMMAGGCIARVGGPGRVPAHSTVNRPGPAYRPAPPRPAPPRPAPKPQGPMYQKPSSQPSGPTTSRPPQNSNNQKPPQQNNNRGTMSPR